jgi:3-deoxy-D-manno-octulosonate cytidylyltransferase
MHLSPKRLGVIPARAASTRFPYKVLASIAGKPLIQRVWEAAQRSRLLHQVVVATDCERVAQAVRGFGGEAIMTPPSLPSGTDRVFYAIQGWDADTVLNLQGDEPLLEGAAIDALIEGFESDASYGMATLAIPRHAAEERLSPHVVKVRFEADGRVEDFSRTAFRGTEAGFFKHLGIYAFRRATLERFCGLPPSAREQSERLEQLRALENGIEIKAVVWPTDTVAVDTPEDVARVEAVLAEREKGMREA